MWWGKTARSSRSTLRRAKEMWKYDSEGTPTNRGFNYWENKDRSDRRIIFAARSYLHQLDAKTGKLITSFGNNGLVNLREGLGRTPIPTGGAQSGSPGHVFENLLVLGSAPGEGYNSPPGDIRAFDVLTGKLVWTFHTIPRPGEFGYDTWPPDAWKTAGGANTWAEFSVDEKRGIGYFPLGIADVRSVGRRSKGRQPLRQHAAGARSPHRQAAVALPAAASRSLGLRSRDRSEAVDGEAERQARRHRRAGDEVRASVCVRSRDGQTDLADRRATGSAERRAGRAFIADAAIPDKASAVLAVEVHRG